MSSLRVIPKGAVGKHFKLVTGSTVEATIFLGPSTRVTGSMPLILCLGVSCRSTGRSSMCFYFGVLVTCTSFTAEEILGVNNYT